MKRPTLILIRLFPSRSASRRADPWCFWFLWLGYIPRKHIAFFWERKSTRKPGGWSFRCINIGSYTKCGFCIFFCYFCFLGTRMDLRWWYLGDSTLVSAIPDAISTFSFPYFPVIRSTARAGMKACSGTCLDPSILFLTTRVFEPMLSAHPRILAESHSWNPFPFGMSDLSVLYLYSNPEGRCIWRLMSLFSWNIGISFMPSSSVAMTLDLIARK